MRLSTDLLFALAAILAAPTVRAECPVPGKPLLWVAQVVVDQSNRALFEKRKVLTDELRSAVGAAGCFLVVDAAAGAVAIETSDNCGEECFVEQGRAASAPYSLGVSAYADGRGARFLATLSDDAKAASIATANSSADALDTRALVVAVRALAAKVISGEGDATAPLAAPPSVASSGPVVRRSAVTASTGDLTIDAKPRPGVRLEITDSEGHTVVSAAPFKNTRATVGRWRVVATATGYEETTRDVDVPPDETTLVKIEMSALAELRVEGRPLGAKVTVSGPGGFRDESGLPWDASGLKSGDYAVVVERRGYTSEKQWVALAGKGQTVNIELKKAMVANAEAGVGLRERGALGHDRSSPHSYSSWGTGESHDGDDTESGSSPPIPPAALVRTASGCPSDMVHIAAGSFLVGSPTNDDMRNFGERNQASLTLGAYCIDLYEFPGKPGVLPKTGVTESEADSSCHKSGKRLCIEEEWEKACKGPANLRFPYGAEFDAAACNTQDADDNARTVGGVGKFEKCRSGYGVFDLSGNVAEWTASAFAPGGGEKAVKGGSASRPGWDTRCASRTSKSPGVKDPKLGFRCCVDGK